MRLSWVPPQAGLADSRPQVPSVRRASSRAEDSLCNLQPASTAFSPTPRVAKANVGFLPAVPPSEACLAHTKFREGRCLSIGSSRHEVLSDGLAPRKGFSRTRSEISPDGPVCAAKIFLTEIKTEMKRAKKNVQGPNFPCLKPDNLF